MFHGEHFFFMPGIIFWIIIILIAVWIISLLINKKETKSSDAYTIAQNRFARGEINEEEYDAIIRKLK